MAYQWPKTGTARGNGMLVDEITLDDRDDIHNWTKALNCTVAELSAAMKAVGNSAAKVKAYLAKRLH
jgi:hypothetical protein